MMQFLAAAGLFVVGLVSAVPARDGAKNVWGNFEDPDKDCVFQPDGGSLSISVPGRDHDLGKERGKMNAPRAMQAVEGDFTISVKVTGKFEPRQMGSLERRAYNGAGFFIRKDDNNYLRLDRATFWNREHHPATVRLWRGWTLREGMLVPLAHHSGSRRSVRPGPQGEANPVEGDLGGPALDDVAGLFRADVKPPGLDARRSRQPEVHQAHGLLGRSAARAGHAGRTDGDIGAQAGTGAAGHGRGNLRADRAV